MHDAFRCVIDSEACGFGRHSCPIEIGCAREGGQVWCMLMRPAPGARRPAADGRHWHRAAGVVHRIPRSALLQHGRALREVAQWLNDDWAAAPPIATAGPTTSPGCAGRAGCAVEGIASATVWHCAQSNFSPKSWAAFGRTASSR
jgi:hypothetical protein